MYHPIFVTSQQRDAAKCDSVQLTNFLRTFQHRAVVCQELGDQDNGDHICLHEIPSSHGGKALRNQSKSSAALVLVSLGHSLAL